MSVHQILLFIVNFRIDSQKCGKKAEQNKKQLYRRHFRGVYILVNSHIIQGESTGPDDLFLSFNTLFVGQFRRAVACSKARKLPFMLEKRIINFQLKITKL